MRDMESVKTMMKELEQCSNLIADAIIRRTVPREDDISENQARQLYGDKWLRRMKKEGLAVLVSFVSGPVEIDTTMLFVGPCLSFAGTVEGASNPPIFIPKLVQYFKEGKFPVDKLATYYPFDDIEKAMEDAHSGKSIKPILLF